MIMDNRTVSQVKKAIRKWPAYIKFAENRGVNPLKIKNINELPVLEKSFISKAIHTVPLTKVRSIIPSSGSTNTEFSYGLFGDMELRKTSDAIDRFLRKRFNTGEKKTVILNLLHGAISFYSSSACVASIGIRFDTAVSAIKSLGSSFEQIILVGEPLFIKNLIEYGIRQSITWEYLPLFVVVGGEWISENFRTYLEGIIGHQRIYSSMGMAELGLHYFYETDESVLLRNIIGEDRRLLKQLFGEVSFCPMLFAFSEDEIYIESIREQHEEFESILLTTIDHERILPLIRCKTGDKGKKLSRKEIIRVLKGSGYGDLIVEDGLPFLAHFGRGREVNGIYPEEIKEIIYCSWQIASAATGNFVLRSGNGITELCIQLKQGLSIDQDIEEACSRALFELPVKVKLYLFEFFPNPLNYERKVQYVDNGDYCGEGTRETIELPVEV